MYILAPFKRLGAVFILFLLLYGCATTAQLANFESFAETGVEYADTLDSLLSKTSESAVEINSLKLLNSRELAPISEANFDEQDKVIKEYLREIASLRKHISLLKEYFQALSKLATSDQSDAFRVEIERSVDVLQKFSEKLQDTSLIENKEAQKRVVGGLGELIVKKVKLTLLQKELKKRKGVIAEILLVHEGMLAAIADELKDKEQMIAHSRYDNEVKIPFLESGDEWTEEQKKSWVKKRMELIRETWVVEELNSAVRAARNLRLAWVKLLENKLTIQDIDAILDDLQSIIAILESTKQLQEKETS